MWLAPLAHSLLVHAFICIPTAIIAWKVTAYMVHQLAHSLLVHAFHLHTYCMEGYCMHGTSDPLT